MPSGIHSTTGDADAETASNQRTAVDDHVLAALAETEADGDTVKTAVLYALYRQQAAVSLEDVLELNVLVAAPEPGPLDERVVAVLTQAVAEHDSWADTAPATLAENTPLSATEGH